MTASTGRSVLDVRGLKCPLPVLRANKAIRALEAGAILEVHATDPAAPQDFVNFCETTGHALVESREAGGIFTMIVRKKADWSNPAPHRLSAGGYFSPPAGLVLRHAAAEGDHAIEIPQHQGGDDHFEIGPIQPATLSYWLSSR